MKSSKIRVATRTREILDELKLLGQSVEEYAAELLLEQAQAKADKKAERKRRREERKRKREGGY